MKFIPVILTLLFVQSISAQEFSFAHQLFEEYETYLEQTIQERRFTQSDIDPLIKDLSEHALFDVKQVGESVEERPIYLVRIGNGDKIILFWSQMHGDESTATMALLDLFNFFSEENDSFSEEKQNMLENVSLYFIPMLNPDGAEIFMRRNALGIDVNRDALRLTSPEAQVLKSVRDSLNPEFGFNLHDQSAYYTAGRVPEAATLSFLAPAYDFERSENEVRTRAMRLIAYLNSMLQHYIPGGVAKYSDAHEPRAFGDMIQKWGTSTILIESGGYPDDPEKQYIRKLNFVTILTAIKAISEDTFRDESVEDYYDIPENESYLTDLLIRNANMVKDGKEYLVDLNIRQREQMIGDTNEYYYRASISDIGDLSTQYGYEELDAEGLKMVAGEIYPDTLKNEQELNNLDFPKLLRQGYTDVYLENPPDTSFVTDVPLNIISEEGYDNKIGLGEIPNLVLKTNDGQVRYVIVNGFVYDVESGETESILNTIVVK
ncbi:MAG: M14 metallopeptidase family protein [Balneolaceae bacterium]